MAIQIIQDVLTPEANLEHGISSSQKVRTLVRPGVITGLNSETSESILFEARNQLLNHKQLGTTHPKDSDYILRRYMIRPAGAGVCNFTEVYEAYTYTALGVWIVEDDSAVQSIEIDWYWDGTNTGVWSRKFINPKLTGTSTQSAITRPSSTVTAVLPMRVIRYTGTVFGYPSGDPGDKVGYVNSNYWKGKDVGGWMITRMRTLADYLGASYTVTAEVTRAHIGDWRSAVRAYSSMDGAYAQIDQTKFDQGMAKPYKQGFIAGRDEGYGYEMFGLYPTTDFNAIFGA